MRGGGRQCQRTLQLVHIFFRGGGLQKQIKSNTVYTGHFMTGLCYSYCYDFCERINLVQYKIVQEVLIYKKTNIRQFRAQDKPLSFSQLNVN